eukprot:160358_1
MGNANTVDAPKSKSNRSNEPNVKYKQTKMNSNSVYAPKQTKMKKVKVEFKLHVVIHLGADETAMAFVYEGKVHHNRFKCRTTKDRRKCRTTKTQILLNSQHECVHFGGGADFMLNIDISIVSFVKLLHGRIGVRYYNID